jgi:hypothetical protein
VVQLLLNIGLYTAFTLTATAAVSASLILEDSHTPVVVAPATVAVASVTVVAVASVSW